jgi:hypothetical protein
VGSAGAVPDYEHVLKLSGKPVSSKTAGVKKTTSGDMKPTFPTLRKDCIVDCAHCVTGAGACCYGPTKKGELMIGRARKKLFRSASGIAVGLSLAAIVLGPSTLWAVPICDEDRPMQPGECAVVLASGFYCIFGNNDCDTQICCGRL